MRKTLLITYILMSATVCLFAQTPQTITLNTPQLTGGTIVACENIKLEAGFKFNAVTANAKLTLKVDPSLCGITPTDPGTDPTITPPQLPTFLGTASPSSNQNYVHTKTMTDDSGTKFLETVQYYDGLGRPMQTVQFGITPDFADLVTYQEYDAYGRDSTAWIPVVAS